jgi:hypothetical protein
VPPAFAAPSSSPVESPAADELTLAELLDLFEPEALGPAAKSPSSRLAGTAMRAWTREYRTVAAGARLGGPRRAW